MKSCNFDYSFCSTLFPRFCLILQDVLLLSYTAYVDVSFPSIRSLYLRSRAGVICLFLKCILQNLLNKVGLYQPENDFVLRSFLIIFAENTILSWYLLSLSSLKIPFHVAGLPLLPLGKSDLRRDIIRLELVRVFSLAFPKNCLSHHDTTNCACFFLSINCTWKFWGLVWELKIFISFGEIHSYSLIKYFLGQIPASDLDLRATGSLNLSIRCGCRCWSQVPNSGSCLQKELPFCFLFRYTGSLTQSTVFMSIIIRPYTYIHIHIYTSCLGLFSHFLKYFI